MNEAKRVAIVVGGTSGIGLATAQLLVAAGMHVVLVGRDRERGIRAAEALGEHAHYEQADVAESARIATVIDGVAARYGRLDAAVNAAALSDVRLAATADITEAEWERTIATDLTGMWRCMKHQLPAMVKGGGGAIVNVSSVNGLAGTPTAAAYCAAKHGIVGLTRTAAIEYAAHGVRVNVVCPGAHRTPMLQRLFETLAPDDPQQAEAMYRARIPAGRVGEPEECARAIAWLVSDAASYVNGAVLTVDGALAAGQA